MPFPGSLVRAIANNSIQRQRVYSREVYGLVSGSSVSAAVRCVGVGTGEDSRQDSLARRLLRCRLAVKAIDGTVPCSGHSAARG